MTEYARNSKVRVGAGEGERFYIRGSISGVGQGSILSPLLFIMNLVIREVATTQEDHNYILHTGSLAYSMLMISICRYYPVSRFECVLVNHRTRNARVRSKTVFRPALPLDYNMYLGEYPNIKDGYHFHGNDVQEFFSPQYFFILIII